RQLPYHPEGGIPQGEALGSGQLAQLVDGPVFFFSSRRRHTRFSRDWSSDVCSSDLWRVASWEFPSRTSRHGGGALVPVARGALRSEERRVGKECRSRWSPDREKQTRGASRRRRFKHALEHASRSVKMCGSTIPDPVE